MVSRAGEEARHRIQAGVDVVLRVDLPVVGARATVRAPGAPLQSGPEEVRRHDGAGDGAGGGDGLLGVGGNVEGCRRKEKEMREGDGYGEKPNRFHGTFQRY